MFRPSAYYTWHRRLGIIAALVITIISVTGLVLLVLPGSKAGRAEIGGSFVAIAYGQTPDYGPVGVDVSGRWLVMVDNALYFNGTPVDVAVNAPLLGAVSGGDGVLVAFGEQLLLISDTGDVLDMITEPILPGALKAIGRTPDQVLIIETPDGVFEGDESLSFWTETDGQAFDWSEVSTRLPDAERKAAISAFRGGGIPLERIVLDLHTGRLFGVIGQVLVWIGTLIMLFLTVTGAIMWWRRFKRFRPKKGS